MQTALIVFSSSVSGSRLKKLTFNANFKDVRITQTPSSIKTAGCSYALRVNTRDLKDILAIAHRYNIHYSAVYKEDYDVSGTPVYTRI